MWNKILKKLKLGKIGVFNKLGIKIGLGFGSLIVFSIIIFFISNSGFGIIERETNISSNMSQFVSKMKDIHKDQKDFILTNQKQDEEKVKIGIEELTSFAEDIILNVDKETKTNIVSLMDYIGRYKVTFDNYTQLSFSIIDERENFNELKEGVLLAINQLSNNQRVYIDNLIYQGENLSTIRSENNVYGLVSNLKDTIYQITIAEREFIINMEIEELQDKYITITRDEIDKANSILKKLSLLFRRDTEKLEQVKEYLKKIEESFEGIVRYELERDQQQPMMNENINQAVNIVRKLEQEAVNKVKDVQVQAVNRLMYVGMGLLLIAGLLSFIITRRITLPVNEAVILANNIANGKLSINGIKRRSKDEIGIMGNSLNKMLNNLQDMIRQISNTSEHLSASSEELLASGEQVSLAAEQVGSSIESVASGAEEQSAQMEQAAVNVDNMVNQIKRVGADAKLIYQGADNVNNNISIGKDSLENSIVKVNQVNHDTLLVSENIQSLGKTTDKIGEIIDLINGIAGQTNLLALNAAIEAARAGEAGRGFSVVADEIRNLAEESSTATEDIVNLIKDIQKNVTEAVGKMDKNVISVKESVNAIEETKTAFNKIDLSNKKLEELVERISDSIQIIVDNSQEVEQVINDVAAISRESAGNAEEVAATSEEQISATEEIVNSARQLTGIAEQLIQVVNRFEI